MVAKKKAKKKRKRKAAARAGKVRKPKNTKKGESYTWAFERINQAIKEGYFFEAIAIEESIIADRLLSYARPLGFEKLANKCTLGDLTQWASPKSAGPLPHAEDKKTFDAVEAWRPSRNKVLHGVAKSEPGTPTDLPTFLDHAKETAEKGKKLAREVADWHRKAMSRDSAKPSS